MTLLKFCPSWNYFSPIFPPCSSTLEEHPSTIINSSLESSFCFLWGSLVQHHETSLPALVVLIQDVSNFNVSIAHLKSSFKIQIPRLYPTDFDMWVLRGSPPKFTFLANSQVISNADVASNRIIMEEQYSNWLRQVS